jgi:hypothetical protein
MPKTLQDPHNKQTLRSRKKTALETATTISADSACCCTLGWKGNWPPMHGAIYNMLELQKWSRTTDKLLKIKRELHKT